LDLFLFSLILGEAVDNALLLRQPADVDGDEDIDDDMLTLLLVSTSDMLLSNEYRYMFI